ncbi:Hypothetical_protein [Hexamita inflata]|uniref:Hypothetical_protein n=1 Tax=Hexamita inflata TaxID=28002 RepID=A0AA86QYG1_9EUKA|nr:Hypothetical protein HINF_LOCUS49763 [Hexamita inflata]
MYYYEVTLPKNKAMSDSKNIIKTLYNCQLKNSGIGKVLIQVKSKNVDQLKNLGYYVSSANGFNEVAFAMFQEPQEVRNAKMNHENKQQQKIQQQVENVLQNTVNNYLNQNGLTVVRQQPVNRLQVYNHVEQMYAPRISPRQVTQPFLVPSSTINQRTRIILGTNLMQPPMVSSVNQVTTHRVSKSVTSSIGGQKVTVRHSTTTKIRKNEPINSIYISSYLQQ